MGKNFKKFKRKARIHAILSSLLLGICSGAVFTALIMLVRKLAGEEFKTLYGIIGVGIAVAVSLALYFIFMPSDRRLARRLDKLYEMEEKVSTMVEFRNDSGDFYQLQREDAEEKLGNKPRKAMKSKALLTGIISFVVSVGILVGAIALPVKAEVEEPIDEFDKQWILATLNELIETVQANAWISEGLKKDTLDQLELLVDFVEQSNLMSEMKKEAIKAVSVIDNSLDRANTAVAIGEKFEASSDPKIASLGTSLKTLSPSGTRNALTEMGSAMANADSQTVGFAAAEINSYLLSSGTPIDDPVHAIFKTLVFDIQNATASDMEDIFKRASTDLIDDITYQVTNATTITYVISTLCDLFGITTDDLANEGVDVVVPDGDISGGVTDGGGGDMEDDDDDNPLGTGGLGTGEIIYGSNDMIYDPNKNEYVPYSELINEYFAKINELIIDGKTTDEAAKLAEYYYGLLFGSSNENSN